MNIPEFLRVEEPYSCFNREERNVAAILYHLLLTKGNLARFISLTGADLDTNPDKVEIYYEFAYLRDVWHHHGGDNDRRRQLILTFLNPSNRPALEEVSVLEFNQYFGAGRPSAEYIQSPGRWSLSQLAQNLPEDEFLKSCRFKWAFNIKPDRVLLDQAKRSVCVEAKLESHEGAYPSGEAERAEFSKRGLDLIRQTEMQTYLLQDLLGFEASFVFLVKSPNAHSPTHRHLSWADAFEALDASGSPPFIQDWIASLP